MSYLRAYPSGNARATRSHPRWGWDYGLVGKGLLPGFRYVPATFGDIL